MLLVQMAFEMFFSYVVNQSQWPWFGWQRIIGLALIMSIAGLVSSFNLLKYFAWKKYWWTFISALVTACISLLLTYAFFLWGTGTIDSETYGILNYATWLSFTHCGISIFISKARKNFWLLLYGLLVALFSGSYMIILFWYGELYQGNWTYVAHYGLSFSYIVLCIHIYSEIRNLNTSSDDIIDN
jgi:hypothetical protein